MAVTGTINILSTSSITAEPGDWSGYDFDSLVKTNEPIINSARYGLTDIATTVNTHPWYHNAIVNDKKEMANVFEDISFEQPIILPCGGTTGEAYLIRRMWVSLHRIIASYNYEARISCEYKLIRSSGISSSWDTNIFAIFNIKSVPASTIRSIVFGVSPNWYSVSSSEYGKICNQSEVNSYVNSNWSDLQAASAYFPSMLNGAFCAKWAVFIQYITTDNQLHKIALGAQKDSVGFSAMGVSYSGTDFKIGMICPFISDDEYQAALATNSILPQSLKDYCA